MPAHITLISSKPQKKGIYDMHVLDTDADIWPNASLRYTLQPCLQATDAMPIVPLPPVAVPSPSHPLFLSASKLPASLKEEKELFAMSQEIMGVPRAVTILKILKLLKKKKKPHIQLAINLDQDMLIPIMAVQDTFEYPWKELIKTPFRP